MSLKVTCLGGAAAWPNPGQGCSSFLFSSGDALVLVDCGPNTLLELRKHVLYSRIHAAVISHCHSDHILDLVPYRYGLVYGPERPQAPIPLYLPPGGSQVLNGLAEVLGGKGEETSGFWDPAFSLQEYDPARPLSLDGVDITFQRTEHAAECYAMRITAGGRSIVYSADTGEFQLLATFAEGCDVLIAEATMPEGSDEESAGHLTPSQAGQLAVLSDARRLVLTHLWSERPDTDVLAGVQEHYGGPVQIAKPGLVVHA